MQFEYFDHITLATIKQRRDLGMLMPADVPSRSGEGNLATAMTAFDVSYLGRFLKERWRHEDGVLPSPFSGPTDPAVLATAKAADMETAEAIMFKGAGLTAYADGIRDSVLGVGDRPASDEDAMKAFMTVIAERVRSMSPAGRDVFLHGAIVDGMGSLTMRIPTRHAEGDERAAMADAAVQYYDPEESLCSVAFSPRSSCLGLHWRPEHGTWFLPEAEDLARAGMLTMMEGYNRPNWQRAEALVTHYRGLEGIVFQDAPDLARRKAAPVWRANMMGSRRALG